MLNLDELVFKANTTELDGVIAKLDKLQQAATDLNNVTAKVEVQQKKQAKAQDDAAKAAEKQAKETAKATEATKNNLSALEKQQTILEFMREGYSKGQATTLAFAKATGTLTADMMELGKVLKDQRKLQGSDAFDASVGGLEKLRNQYNLLTESVKLHNSASELTSKQAIELSRDIMRLTDVLKASGATEDQITAKLNEHTKAYKDTAAQVIQLEQAERNKMKTERDRLNAITSLSKEEEKLKTIHETLLTTTNGEIAANEKSATMLARYSQMLKTAGVSSSDYVNKLDAYKRKLLEVQALEEKQKTQYITRAVGPQLTDIFSGLATGQQSLYTILVQQGGQLADQFAMAGIQANKMGEVLKNALPQMLGNITNIGRALGTMVVGGFVSASQAAGGFAAEITGVSFLMEKLKGYFASQGEAGFTNIAKVMRIAETATFALAGALAVLATAVVAFGVAAYQVYQENTELTKSLILTGSTMGLTKDAALEYAESLKSIGVTSSQAVEVMTAMGKEGKFTKDQIALITKAAIDLSTYGGVAITDTVKEFAKLQDKPTKALQDIAEKTGFVSIQVLDLVDNYEKQGKKTEAVALATQELGRVTAIQANLMKDSLIPIEVLWIDIKKAIGGAWEQLKEFSKSDTVASTFRTVWQAVAVTASEVWYVLKMTGKEIGGIGAQIAAVLRGDFSGAAAIGEAMKADAKAARDQQDAYVAGIMKMGEEQKKVVDNNNKILEDAAKNAKLAEYRAEWEKITGGNLSKQKKLEEEIVKIKELGLALGKSEKEINDEIAAAKAKHATKEKKPKKTELQKEYEAFQKYLSDIEDKASGFNKNYSEILKSLDTAFVEGWFSKDAAENFRKYQDALAALDKSQPGVIAAHNAAKQAAKEQADAIKHLNKMYEDLTEAVNQYSGAYISDVLEIRAENTEISNRLSLIGLTAKEQELLTKEYKRQAEIQKIQNKYEEDRLKILSDKRLLADPNEMRIALEQIEKIRNERISIIDARASIEALEEVDKAFRGFKETISESIVSALFEGGQSGSKKIRDALVAALRQPLTISVNALVNSVLSGGSSPTSVASIGSNSLMGGISGLTTGLGAGVTSIAQAGVGGWLSASTSLIGTGTLSGIGAGVGMLAGPLALVAGITQLIKSLDDSGTLHTGGISSYSAATGTRTSTTHGAFGTGFGGVELGEATVKMTSDLVKSIVGVLDSTAKVFGKEAGYSAATAFADDTSKDGAWGALVIEQFGKALVNWDSSRTSKWAPKEFADGEAGQKQYLAAVAKDVAGVLKEMDLPKWAADILDQIGTDPSMENLTAALAEISAMPEKILNAIGTSTDALAEIIVTGMKNADPEKAGQDFADAITFGIENSVYSGFASQISSIVSTQVVTPVVNALMTGASITEAMSRASINTMLEQVKAVTSAMSSVLSDPAFKEALKTLNATIAEAVGGAVAQGATYGFQSGNGGTTTVKETVEANNALGSSASDATDSTKTLADSLKSLQDETINLQAQLDTLQGRTTQANAALYALATEGMTAAEKAVYDWNLELKRQIKVETEYQDLQAKVWEVTGQTAKLRERELAALEPVNRAIQQWLWNLEDTAAALDKAIASQERLLEFAKTNVESTFDVLSRSVEALKAKAEKAANKTDSAYSLLEKSIQTQLDVAEKASEAAKEARDNLKELFTYLTDQVNELFGTVSSTSSLQAQSARKTIRDALASGVLPDSETLQKAVEAVRTGIDNQIYTTKVDADKARLTFANELQALAGISESQLSESERQLKASEDSVKHLEDILTNAKNQIDALRGVDTRVLSVDQAITEFQAAYLQEQQALQELSTADEMLAYAQDQLDALNGLQAVSTDIKGLLDQFINAVNIQSGLQTGQSVVGQNGAAFNTITRMGKTSEGTVFNQMSLDALKAWYLAGDATPDRYQALYGIVANSGFTLSQAESMLGAPSGSFENWAKANNLPTFATGGMHDGGIALVGERGKELINTGPARVFNAAQTAEILSGAGGKSSLMTNEDEMQLLRAEVRAVAINTAKVYTLLDRAVQPDDSLAVTVNNTVTTTPA